MNLHQNEHCYCYLPSLLSPLLMLNIWVLIVKLLGSAINVKCLPLVGQILHQLVLDCGAAQAVLSNLRMWLN